MHLADHYGADSSGLVCGYLFLPDQAAQLLSTQQVMDCLTQKNLENINGFLWLHFNLSHAASEKWLKNNLSLPTTFYEALHEGSRTTRIEHADQALIAVVNDVLYGFSLDSSDISTLWLSVDKHLVVSGRFKPLLSVDRLREAVRKGDIFRSSVELLIHLLRDQEDILVSIVRQTTQRVDTLEDKILAKKNPPKRMELGSLRRVLVRLQRLLALEPAAMFRFLHHPPQWVDEKDISEFRQSTEEFALALEDMNALVERIKLLQEEVAAQLNERTNRHLFVLTTVTVLALPINLVAGLFGMNVGGIPLSNTQDGFWVVVTAVLILTGTLVAILFRLIRSWQE